MNIISLSQRLLNIKAKPIALFLPIVLYLSACSSLDQGASIYSRNQYRSFQIIFLKSSYCIVRGDSSTDATARRIFFKLLQCC